MVDREELNRMYPGNNNMNKPLNKKETKTEIPEKKERVTKGKVMKKKPSFGKKLLSLFVGEEVGDVKTYLIEDVLVPAAKNTLFDMISGGSELFLFGKRRPIGNGNRSGTRVNYNGISSGNGTRRDLSPVQRARFDFDDIVFESKWDAEQVISSMIESLERFHQVTVADLYDAAGITSEFTDNKFGWTNLSSATVRRVREGYVLSLPRPISLD